MSGPEGPNVNGQHKPEQKAMSNATFQTPLLDEMMRSAGVTVLDRKAREDMERSVFAHKLVLDHLADKDAGQLRNVTQVMLDNESKAKGTGVRVYTAYAWMQQAKMLMRIIEGVEQRATEPQNFILPPTATDPPARRLLPLPDWLKEHFSNAPGADIILVRDRVLDMSRGAGKAEVGHLYREGDRIHIWCPIKRTTRTVRMWDGCDLESK